MGKRIATSFVGLSKKYFEGLEAKVAKVVDDGKEWMNGDGGEGKGKEMQTSVLPLGGSVETACALGAADGIVDLVGKFLTFEIPLFFSSSPPPHAPSFSLAGRRLGQAKRPHPSPSQNPAKQWSSLA